MIVGSFVIHNESQRILEKSLRDAKQHVDELFVFDDQSTDNSIEIANQFTSHVVMRDNDTPSFMENESEFRQTAWQTMINRFGLQSEDWVLSLDADEFFIGERSTLNSMIQLAEDMKYLGWKIHIPEIWDIDTFFMKRVDGFWDTNFGTRFVKVNENFSFVNKKMGCGSTPILDESKICYSPTIDVMILHLGYALSDLMEKYNHYNNVPHGHNQTHINSIITHPTLERYTGKIPNVLHT